MSIRSLLANLVKSMLRTDPKERPSIAEASFLFIFACVIFMVFYLFYIFHLPSIAEAFFLFLLGGLGTIASPSTDALNMMVASVVLFKFFLACSVQQMNHTVSAEMPALQLRRKSESSSLEKD